VTLQHRVTFSELEDRHRRLAGALTSEGLGRGDRVAVFSSNRAEALEVCTGALRIGVVPVPINALLTPPEIAYLIDDSGARWLFTDGPVESHPALDKIVTFGDAYERLLHEAEAVDVADVTLGRPMHYTSGTTGAPKGVWVAPHDLDGARRVSTTFRKLWGMSADDVHLVCSPLAHSAPLRFSMRTLEAGGSVVLQGHFDAEETLAAIEMFGVTSTFMVPTHIERILALGRKAQARYDLSSLRLLAHAGAPIRDNTKRLAIELFPLGSLWEFYGSTEGQATRISTEEWLAKPGSVGRPIPGADVVITAEDGTPLRPKEVGEVWVKEATGERFDYWRDKRKTQRAWRGDLFSVGDLGHLDDDGYLYLDGRKHDTIITGGVNVYPQEVESVLLSHPAVAEASVYGEAHPEWGQQVCALVVASFGNPLDAELLREWARERLAGYKCPRRIQVVEELPRTVTGKVRRGPPD
jgi:acyl-CoA synthetase (AMP-forming)/AMP-acid ligase II